MSTMLKRKRSDSELSFSSTSTMSSPPRPLFGAAAGMDLDVVSTGPSVSFLGRVGASPRHLHSRTMKRFRDNRPSEREIHRHTLDLLYSAQQHLPVPVEMAEAVPARSTGSLETPAATAAQSSSRLMARAAQQASLHSFWNIPQPPPPTSLSAVVVTRPTLGGSSCGETVCEDCGASVGGDEDLCTMDLDSGDLGAAERCCVACGKVVCFSCSISQLGQQRRCLLCAGTSR